MEIVNKKLNISVDHRVMAIGTPSSEVWDLVYLQLQRIVHRHIFRVKHSLNGLPY